MIIMGKRDDVCLEWQLKTACIKVKANSGQNDLCSFYIRTGNSEELR
ncbi:MAG: hypothetical protein HFE67_04560 [Erysipelotrichaceae bacterium]|nr:hypothetical protein [Erysipelotrichaceae bacterium]